MIGFGLKTEGVADDFFGMPVQNDAEIQPAPAVEFNFGHIDTPELVGARRDGFGAQGAAFWL